MAELEWVILADNAEVSANRLFLMGGGWDTLTPPSFQHPVAHVFALAISVLVEWGELVERREQRVSVAHRPLGGELRQLAAGIAVPERTPLMREGDRQRAQFAIKVALAFEGPGTHDLVVTLNDQAPKTVRFYVNAPPVQAAAIPEPPPPPPRRRPNRR